jgi:predicted AAA+ superfamily ATPase
VAHHEDRKANIRYSWHLMKYMIDRKDLVRYVRSALRRSRVVALIVPRQCGKTTLAQQLLDVDSQNYFDLEDPSSLAVKVAHR